MRCLQAPAQVYESSDDQEFDVDASPPPPFELELLEAALMVATGDNRYEPHRYACSWMLASQWASARNRHRVK